GGGLIRARHEIAAIGGRVWLQADNHPFGRRHIAQPGKIRYGNLYRLGESAVAAISLARRPEGQRARAQATADPALRGKVPKHSVIVVVEQIEPGRTE